MRCVGGWVSFLMAMIDRYLTTYRQYSPYMHANQRRTSACGTKEIEPTWWLMWIDSCKHQ